MHFSYKLNCDLNSGKKETLLKTAVYYRDLKQKLSNIQIREFQSGNKFNKFLTVKDLDHNLSARYLQTAQTEVVGTLISFISNCKNDVRDTIYSSDFSKYYDISLIPEKELKKCKSDADRIDAFNNAFKHQLRSLNVKEKWYGDGNVTNENVLMISKSIWRYVIKTKNSYPTFKKLVMTLDQKVCVNTAGVEGEATEFDYWLKVSTYEAGKPILLPLITNQYFENAQGEVKNSVQFVFDQNHNLSVNLCKSLKDYKELSLEEQLEIYDPQTERLGLDFGFAVMFASEFGELSGLKFQKTLLAYDVKITKIAAANQKRTGKVRSPKYDREVEKLRTFLKNNIGMALNRYVKRHKPRTIVLEKLNFQNANLSRRMNRMLSRYGRQYINAKLMRFEETYGIVTEFVNPAYTSQECSSCGYVDKANRPKRDTFLCRWCGLKLHADVSGARIIKARSSRVDISVNHHRNTVIRILTSSWCKDRHIAQENASQCRLAGTLKKNKHFNFLFKPDSA